MLWSKPGDRDLARQYIESDTRAAPRSTAPTQGKIRTSKANEGKEFRGSTSLCVTSNTRLMSSLGMTSPSSTMAMVRSSITVDPVLGQYRTHLGYRINTLTSTKTGTNLKQMYNILFDFLSQHCNHANLFFPNHSPKRSDRGGSGTLSADVRRLSCVEVLFAK
jgi:hypothetical protein